MVGEALQSAGVAPTVAGAKTKQVERPKETGHGDFASSVALSVAKMLRQSPMQVAEQLVANMTKEVEVVERIEIAKPGFINLYVNSQCLHRVVNRIEAADRQYGKSQALVKHRTLVEFVSANPTGSLNVVSGRAAAVGSALFKLMREAGAEVYAEYYVNDVGRQTRLLGSSLAARIRQVRGEGAEVPEDGYQGEEVQALAKEILGEMKSGEPLDDMALAQHGIAAFLKSQERDLESFGVIFDRWFREHTLHEEGAVKACIKRYEEAGALYQHEGATWLRLTDRGMEKDEVLVRQGGDPTYFAADIAYHLNKFERGYLEALDFWGPDHHGHIQRLQKALELLGIPSGWLEVRIVQQVNLISKGEKVKMSKRAGQTVRLSELVKEVGLDAVRYFFLMRSIDSHLDFDVDLAKKQSEDNPVFYVQYAHARACNILGHAKEEGVIWTASGVLEGLDTPEEYQVFRDLDRFPEVIEQAALSRAPSWVTTYLADLAATFHHFYAKHRVVSDDQALTQARLRLVNAVRITLQNGLTLLGVSAPERM